MRQQKQIVVSYLIVLTIWGILQPLAALFSLLDSETAGGLSEQFFFSTNFITFSAVFFTLSIAQSNNTFLGEKSAQTLNTLLSTPVKIHSLIVGKWLSSVLYVALMAVSILICQWITYVVTMRAINLVAPFIFPSVTEILQAFLPLILLWGVACWYGAFVWLKFDNYQSANITSILLVLPLLGFEYLAIEYSISIIITVPILLAANLILGFAAVLINHRDRLAQLS